MKKMLTFNEFKNKLSSFDKQLSIYNEFIETSNPKVDIFQILFYENVITHIKIQKEQILKDTNYSKYIEQMKLEQIKKEK